MKRHIHLRDVLHLIEKRNFRECTQAEFERALAHNLKIDLRYDNATGKMRDNELGVICELSNPKEHVPHDNLEDVLRWQFWGWINNSISRIQRGLEP